MLAPIIVFCYNRPDHLKRTLTSLALNPLAASSELIVFSDGPKQDSDNAKIKELRAYLKTLNGFKSVEVIESVQNKGLANSIISGVSTVLSTYEKAIIMEDDLLCTTDFLDYINEALNIYENNDAVFSVSGYSFGLPKFENYNEDVALIHRASSLGWGTWKNRWEKVDWTVSDFQSFLKDTTRKDNIKNAGEDLLPMIVKQQRGLIDSWAVRWTYHHVKYGGYCLVPLISKIKITGDDGSGSNPVASTISDKTPYGKGKVKFNPSIKPIASVTQYIRTANRPSLIRKLINWYKYRIW